MSESGAEIQSQTPSISELSRQFVVFEKEPVTNHIPDNVPSKDEDAKKIMDGAFVANPSFMEKVFTDNRKRREKLSDATDLPFEEWIVLTASKQEIFIQGTSLTEQEIRDRLVDKAGEKIAELERLPTNGELMQRQVTALDKFRKQLVDTTPPVSTDSL